MSNSNSSRKSRWFDRKVGQESSVVTLIEKPLTKLSSSFKIMFIKLLLNFNHFIRMPTKVFFVTRQNEDVEIPRPFFVALKRSLLTSNAYWIGWIFSVILSVSFLPDLPLLKFKDVDLIGILQNLLYGYILGGWRLWNATLSPA